MELNYTLTDEDFAKFKKESKKIKEINSYRLKHDIVVFISCSFVFFFAVFSSTSLEQLLNDVGTKIDVLALLVLFATLCFVVSRRINIFIPLEISGLSGFKDIQIKLTMTHENINVYGNGFISIAHALYGKKNLWETENYYLLKYNNNRMVIIPKTAFASDEQIQEIEFLVDKYKQDTKNVEMPLYRFFSITAMFAFVLWWMLVMVFETKMFSFLLDKYPFSIIWGVSFIICYLICYRKKTK